MMLKSTFTLLLLSSCMLAVDWSVKQRYWASKANYHLVIFSFSVFALPIESWNNWLLMFFFFFWIALNYLVGIDPSGNQNKKFLMRSFSFYLEDCFTRKGLSSFLFYGERCPFKGDSMQEQRQFLYCRWFHFIYLEVIFTFIFPQGFLIALPKIEQVEFSLLGKHISS